MVSNTFEGLLTSLYRSHPWHDEPPFVDESEVVNAYIEMVPSDNFKIELNKFSGHPRVDRPLSFSSRCPSLYGLVPQTYCGKRVAARAAERTGRKRIKGDGDPLDICVITSDPFYHGDLFVKAIPIGGLPMIDKGQADDKIIAVLEGDVAFGQVRDIGQLSSPIIERLKHYFLSYKRDFSTSSRRQAVRIGAVYGREEALEVIRLSIADYLAEFGTKKERFEALLQLVADRANPTC